jgi:hypothetical protein
LREVGAGLVVRRVGEHVSGQLTLDSAAADPAARHLILERLERLAVDAAKAQIALNLDSDRFRMQAADAGAAAVTPPTALKRSA